MSHHRTGDGFEYLQDPLKAPLGPPGAQEKGEMGPLDSELSSERAIGPETFRDTLGEPLDSKQSKKQPL